MQITFKQLTREDCERFKREHPTMTRKYMYQHYGIYVKAMQRLGCFDELYPKLKLTPSELTVEDCEKFRQEHPSLTRRELRIHHGAYYRAMKTLGCADRLYPARKVFMYSDEELITAARKYKHVRDLNANEPEILKAIYYRGGELRKEALKHMKPLGNRKWKMIYVYEFSDHSAYVGLTYDRERRKKDHLYEENSAVRRHVERTGLEPVYRQLTDYIPVKDAQRLEGEWVDKYRREGWKILNVVAAGSIGGREGRIDKEKVIELFKQGVQAKAIPNYVEVAYSTVLKILKKAGLSYRGMSSVPIEVMDDDGRVISSFPSVKAAAEHYGMKPENIRKNIRYGYRIRGKFHRYNPDLYFMKHGKMP